MSTARLGSSRWVPLPIALTLIVVASLSSPVPASAATLRVRPGGGGGYYADIQAAINAASGNDVIHVYPGTYGGVVLNTMTSPGNISIIAVDSSGTPTPRTVTVNGGSAPAFDSAGTHPGDVTIDGFVVTSTSAHGISVDATGDVLIEDVAANATGGDGISSVSGSGDVTVRNCAANNNSNPVGGTGIHVSAGHGTLTIENCIANNNYLNGIGFWEHNNVRITGNIARGNGRAGIAYAHPIPILTLSASAKGNIICGNIDRGLYVGTGGGFTLDAEGNWWGCPGGPGSPGCDTIHVVGPGTVDFTPWISTYSAQATPGSVVVGQPVQINFRFSDSASTVFLPRGPGDLNGEPTFTLHTDNGTLTDADETGATVHGFIGSGDALSVTLVPDALGTATVTAEGPCDLSAEITVDVEAEEFVPEPGSLLLLAGGVMGLAGYGALRLRSGQALRWRGRE
jgi:hypothetical protein